MKGTAKLDNDEFRQMITLLKRYAETDMDQWELWKLNSDAGELFINISLKANGPESSYTSLDDAVISK